MEEQVTLTQTQVLEIFAKWRADATEGNWKDGTPEGDAKTFMDYARQVES